MCRASLRPYESGGPAVTLAFVLAFVVTLSPVRGAAQDTRADAIAQEQAAKAQQLSPPELTTAERVLDRVQDFLTGASKGLFPTVDSVYSGGGFTPGLVYQQFIGDRTAWNVRGLYSIRSYKLIDLNVISPGHAQGKVDVSAHVGWRDATQIAFYGLGINSPQSAHTNFRLNETYAGADVRVRPVWPVTLGGGVWYHDYTEKSGTGASPSIEEVFTPATAPGLRLNPTYVHTFASAGIDSRPSPGYARTGGLYEVAYHNFADTDDRASFDRLDVDAVQHIPILRETWVLSLHGRVQTTLDDTDTVPYFLLPSLGSGSTLRAYSSWRFRDRHSLLMQGEWRWIPNRLGLDMALFYDAGKVAPRRADLDLKGLKSNAGIGIRFHGPAATPLRVELARGSEGWNIVFAGSPSF